MRRRTSGERRNAHMTFAASVPRHFSYAVGLQASELRLLINLERFKNRQSHTSIQRKAWEKRRNCFEVLLRLNVSDYE